MGYKIREAQTRKIPYTLVLGDNEKNNNTVTYRKFGEDKTSTVTIEAFLELIENQIKQYK